MLNNVEIRHLHSGHLPVVRGCLDRLGIQDVLDRHLPAHPQSQASDAECTVAMVLNILSGRVALWQMDDHLAGMDVELLLGEGVEASWFHDTRLGKALDRIDAAGTDTLLSEIVLGYLTSSEPAPYSVHLDTTSFVLYGAYLDAEEPVPLHGYSKDRRPDLKQLVFGMSVHSGLGFPLTATMCSGNTSDHAANRAHIAQLAVAAHSRCGRLAHVLCGVAPRTSTGSPAGSHGWPLGRLTSTPRSGVVRVPRPPRRRPSHTGSKTKWSPVEELPLTGPRGHPRSPLASRNSLFL